MADAMFLILFIIIMYLIINETEDYLMLLIMGLLFTLVSMAVLNQTIAGSYTELFTAPVDTSSPLLGTSGIAAVFSTIPIFAFAKVIIRRQQKKNMSKQIIPADDI